MDKREKNACLKIVNTVTLIERLFLLSFVGRRARGQGSNTLRSLCSLTHKTWASVRCWVCALQRNVNGNGQRSTDKNGGKKGLIEFLNSYLMSGPVFVCVVKWNKQNIIEEVIWISNIMAVWKVKNTLWVIVFPKFDLDVDFDNAICQANVET